LNLIRADVAADRVRVDNPTQNLESYFLEVVAKAKQAAAETSGAQSGGTVAAYLRGEGEAAAPSAKILERLTVPAAGAQGSPVVEKTEPTAPAVDVARLESMARPEPAALASPETKPEPETPAPAVDLTKANEKLSSLLNKLNKPK
jgi:hypothetical protein